MPAVSVLMVTHRDTEFLRPAIASVLGQTLADLELVLVDNGAGLSPGALGELGRDPRLRWVRFERNQGIPAGHNAAVAAARAEYVALLDHDDVMLPHRLERQVAHLAANPGLALVSSGAESIDERGKVTGREFSLAAADEQQRYTQFAAPVVTPAYAGRRSTFERFAYRPEFALTADFDFLARVGDSHAMAGLPDVLLQYRHHRSQTTAAQSRQIKAERCVVRLLTARRRAGRPEGADRTELLAEAARADRDAAAAAFACARQCAAEGFPVLAAYHARRGAAERRTPAAFVTALGIYRAVRRDAGAAQAEVARMFFRGPVRALGLHPA